MEFFIRQGATDPILKLKLIDDGKNDKTSFYGLLENSKITIDMFNVKNKEYLIIGGECGVTTRTQKFGFEMDEYYIVYRFDEIETGKPGRYEAIVTINFFDNNQQPTSKLILPIQEKLFINVI